MALSSCQAKSSLVAAQKPELCFNSKHAHEQITACSLLLSKGHLFAHKYMEGSDARTHTNTHACTHAHTHTHTHY